MFYISKIELDNVVNELSIHQDVFKNTTFLITGGTGFIGKWLVATLNQMDLNQELDINVYILTRNKTSFKDQFPDCVSKKNIHFIEGDIRSLDHLGTLNIGFDYIILGANDATYDFSLDTKVLSETLIGGTFNLLKTFVSSKTKSIIHLSSGAVYGDISEHKNGARETDKSSIDINSGGFIKSEHERRNIDINKK